MEIPVLLTSVNLNDLLHDFYGNKFFFPPCQVMGSVILNFLFGISNFFHLVGLTFLFFVVVNLSARLS